MLRLKINGQLYSKSNSRQFTYRGGKPLLIKNPRVLAYTEDALWQLKTQLNGHKTFENPVRIIITIWYQSRRSDLDISLIQDIFEKAGVYKNDRLVEHIVAYKKFDKLNPRLEAIVEEIE